MAALAPFGTDYQPNTRAILKAGKLIYVPSYSSQRNRTQQIQAEYHGDVPFYPPSMRQEHDQPLWAKRSPLPPIVGTMPNGPFSIREIERSDGSYMDDVKWQPEKINSNADMSQAIQVKRLLEGWPRESLKKIYLSVAEHFDKGLTDQVYRGNLANVCIACRLPLTARVLEKLFDRFSLVRDPNNVDYKKFLIYLDTVFEVADFKRKGAVKNIGPLSFPLPAPSQEEILQQSELAQTFREMHERTARNPDSSNWIDVNQSGMEKLEEPNQVYYSDREPVEKFHSMSEDEENKRAGRPSRHVNNNPESFEKSAPSQSFHGSKIDSEDAELLALLVSHLSKKGRHISLQDIKKAFYDADSEKSTFLTRAKVKDILRKNFVSLDDWLLDALLNRCDIDNTGDKTCWIAIVEFLERVQPFTLKKAPLSPTRAVEEYKDMYKRGYPNMTEQSENIPERLPEMEEGQNRATLMDESLAVPQSYTAMDKASTDPVEYQSRINNLVRALRSADIDNSGVIASDDALRLMRNYNTVYQLNMDEFDIMRFIHNSTHQGQVVVDSLCDCIRLETSLLN